MEIIKAPDELPRFGMRELYKLCKDKNVCLIGSVPPKKSTRIEEIKKGESAAGIAVATDQIKYLQDDVVVRCNDWWAHDEGRMDVLFHIGASTKIKISWLLAQDDVLKY